MKHKQLSPAQLEACKFYGVTKYPELGVLSALVLGIYKEPNSPETIESSTYIDVCGGEGSSLDKALSDIKDQILYELSVEGVKEDDITYIDLYPDSGNELSVSYLRLPLQQELREYEEAVLISKEMKQLLPKVLAKVEEFSYLDDEKGILEEVKRREDIKAQIAALQKQL